MRCYSQGNAECLSGICVVIDIAKVVFAVSSRNDVVTHKCVVLVSVEERHECLQKRLFMNEVAGCLSVIMRRCRHSKS